MEYVLKSFIISNMKRIVVEYRFHPLTSSFGLLEDSGLFFLIFGNLPPTPNPCFPDKDIHILPHFYFSGDFWRNESRTHPTLTHLCIYSLDNHRVWPCFDIIRAIYDIVPVNSIGGGKPESAADCLALVSIIMLSPWPTHHCVAISKPQHQPKIGFTKRQDNAVILDTVPSGESFS